LGQLASIAARLVEVRLLTALAPPEVYGEVALLMGLATLGAGSFCTPLNTAIARFFPEAKASARIAALREVMGGELRRRALAVASLLVVIGFAWDAAAAQGPGPWGFVLVAFLLCVDSWRLFESDLLNANRQQLVCAFWAAANAWGRMLLAVAALWWIGPESSAILFGYVAAVLVGNLLFRRLRVRGSAGQGGEDASWRRETLRSSRRFVAPLVPVAGLHWVLTLGDRYVLAWLHGASEAGIYAAAYGLTSLPFITWGALLSQTLRPIYFAAFAANDGLREQRILWVWLSLLVAGGSAGVLFFAVFSEPLARIILGEAYWNAAEVMPWIAAAYAIQSLRHLFGIVIQARQRNSRLLISSVVGAVTAVIGFFALIPGLGALGAALGALAGMVTACGVAALLSGALQDLVRPRSS